MNMLKTFLTKKQYLLSVRRLTKLKFVANQRFFFLNFYFVQISIIYFIDLRAPKNLTGTWVSLSFDFFGTVQRLGHSHLN